jgi:chemotaxis protein MotA
MDLATLLGLIAAIGVVLTAIFVGGSFAQFFDISAILIVLGGSASVVMMKFSIGSFFSSVKVALKVLFYRPENPTDIINEIVKLAETARKNGMLSLENMPIKNKFLSHSIRYVIDGIAPDIIEITLNNEMEQTIERHMRGQQIFKSLGETAPAMGMIGTLIGLVQMLSHMADPKKIGPAMAIAMLTTLYGAILANMIALPIADKLELRSHEEKLLKSIIIDGTLAIQQGQNPRIIRDYLTTYLAASQRVKLDKNHISTIKETVS